MKTRNVLLITSDKDLAVIAEMSALTLTKLNAQVSVQVCDDHGNALAKSRPDNIGLIIVDREMKNFDPVLLIREIRSETGSKNKKIILLYSECESESVNKIDIFNSGCDSIMSKEEFKKAVNNIFTI